jgi:phosphoribosylformylglycinamidine cyclo-ligase
VYAPAILALRRKVEVRGLCHVTGGGIPGNLERILPGDCDAVIERGTWETPRIFTIIQAAGAISDEELAHVFNLGLGMLAVVPARAARRSVDTLRAAGHQAWLVGQIQDGGGNVIFSDASG